MMARKLPLLFVASVDELPRWCANCDSIISGLVELPLVETYSPTLRPRI
jgi:hypothetical protein